MKTRVNEVLWQILFFLRKGTYKFGRLITPDFILTFEQLPTLLTLSKRTFPGSSTNSSFLYFINFLQPY